MPCELPPGVSTSSRMALFCSRLEPNGDKEIRQTEWGRNLTSRRKANKAPSEGQLGYAATALKPGHQEEAATRCLGGDTSSQAGHLEKTEGAEATHVGTAHPLSRDKVPPPGPGGFRKLPPLGHEGRGMHSTHPPPSKRGRYLYKMRRRCRAWAIMIPTVLCQAQQRTGMRLKLRMRKRAERARSCPPEPLAGCH